MYENIKTGWWFEVWNIFPYIGNSNPNWLKPPTRKWRFSIAMFNYQRVTGISPSKNVMFQWRRLQLDTSCPRHRLGRGSMQKHRCSLAWLRPPSLENPSFWFDFPRCSNWIGQPLALERVESADVFAEDAVSYCTILGFLFGSWLPLGLQLGQIGHLHFLLFGAMGMGFFTGSWGGCSEQRIAQIPK